MAKKEFPMDRKGPRFAYEVAQELGTDGTKQSKPGITAPSTGADALTEDPIDKIGYRFSRYSRI